MHVSLLSKSNIPSDALITSHQQFSISTVKGSSAIMLSYSKPLYSNPLLSLRKQQHQLIPVSLVSSMGNTLQSSWQKNTLRTYPSTPASLFTLPLLNTRFLTKPKQNFKAKTHNFGLLKKYALSRKLM